MGMLTKEEISKYLENYYKECCGEKDTDIWYDQPAVNVWVFGRNDKIITLHCHVVTGKVTEKVEDPYRG